MDRIRWSLDNFVNDDRNVYEVKTRNYVSDRVYSDFGLGKCLATLLDFVRKCGVEYRMEVLIC